MRRLAALKHCQLRWLSSPLGSKVLDFFVTQGTGLVQNMSALKPGSNIGMFALPCGNDKKVRIDGQQYLV
jgi:hypothetical protein